MQLRGTTVVLTGSGSGIGSALTEALAAEGALIYGLDLRPADPRPGVTPIQADITDPRSIEQALAQIPAPIDLLINNAGVMRRGALFDSTPEDFDLLMGAHVKGSWLMLKHALPRLAPTATIVQMLSRHALLPPADPALYGLAKGTADRMLDLFEQEYPQHRIVRLYPGPTDTPLARHGVEGEALKEKEQRMIAPEALAAQIVTLLKEDKSRLEFEEGTGGYRIL